MTGAHTKRDVKKRKKQTVSFGGRANARPFHLHRANAKRRRWHQERRRGEKRADTRRAALTCEVSDVDVAAAEAVNDNVRALALIRASRLGTFPRLRASPPRPRSRARRDGILPVRGGERPERGGRERDVRGRHAQRPDAAGRAVRYRAEPPVGSHHGASASATARARVSSSRPPRVVVLVSDLRRKRTLFVLARDGFRFSKVRLSARRARAGVAFPTRKRSLFFFDTVSLNRNHSSTLHLFRTPSDARGRGHRGGFRRPRWARYRE